MYDNKMDIVMMVAACLLVLLYAMLAAAIMAT